ncbi:5633_t:CDS:2, partial [Dentiscutata erythropus]
ENPTIIQSYEHVQSLPMPVLLFTYANSFILTCGFTTYDQGNRTCNQYLSNIQYDSKSKMYMSFFKTSETFMPNGINSLSIALASTSSNPNYGIVYITDIESNPLPITNGQIDQTAFTQLITYSNNISDLYTSFVMPTNQLEFFWFTRRIRNVISPKFSDLLGFAPSMEKTTYIDPLIQSMPASTVSATSSSNFLSGLIMAPQNYVVNMQSEQSTFGLVGSLWTIAVGIYVFLFGIDKLNPFGCVIKCPCFRRNACKKLRSAFPVIPFANNSGAQLDVIQLHNRLNALEVFLKERIFDVDYLQDDVAKQENNNMMNRNTMMNTNDMMNRNTMMSTNDMMNRNTMMSTNDTNIYYYT